MFVIWSTLVSAVLVSSSASLSSFTRCSASLSFSRLLLASFGGAIAGKSFCSSFSKRCRTSAGIFSSSSFVSTGPLNTERPCGLLRGQHFLPRDVLELQFPLRVVVNDVRVIQSIGVSFERAVFPAARTRNSRAASRAAWVASRAACGAFRARLCAPLAGLRVVLGGPGSGLASS